MGTDHGNKFASGDEPDPRLLETELPADDLGEIADDALRTRLQDKLISFPDDPPRFVPTETEHQLDDPDASSGKNRVRFWMKPSRFGAYVHYHDYRRKIDQLLHPKGLKRNSWEGHDGEGDDEETWRVVIEHDLFDTDGEYVVCLELEYSEDMKEKAVFALAAPTPEQAREMADALRIYADMAEKQNAERRSDGVF